jgi:6-pyruvoyltetrahydropterin/6-carboxytetrahydropterin synthase
MARYFSTKTYGNDRGLSACFRQWRATHSHCSLLHGYSLGFKFVFEADELDDKNWVQDFGGLSEIKEYLEHNFDHTLAVAEDDPHLEMFQKMAELGLQDKGGVCDIRVMPAVGCEAFAKMVYDYTEQWLEDQPNNVYKNLMGDEYPRVKLKSVECFEHSGNSAIYGD